MSLPVGVIAGARRRAQRRKKQEEQAPDHHDQLQRQPNEDSRRHINEVSATAGALVMTAGILGGAFAMDRQPAVGVPLMFGGIFFGVYLMFAIKIARQWE